MQIGAATADFLASISNAQEHEAVRGDRIVSIQVSCRLLKANKPIEIDSSKSIADLRAAFLATIDPKVLAKHKSIGSLVLFCSAGFWCSPGRSIQSYWFMRDDQLSLCKKKKGKEYRVKFDGSIHVLEMHPSKSTVRSLIQALPKLDIRSYDDYTVMLTTEKRSLSISDWSMNISVLGGKSTDFFVFASPDDLPGAPKKSASTEICKPVSPRSSIRPLSTMASPLPLASSAPHPLSAAPGGGGAIRPPPPPSLPPLPAAPQISSAPPVPEPATPAPIKEPTAPSKPPSPSPPSPSPSPPPEIVSEPDQPLEGNIPPPSVSTQPPPPPPVSTQPPPPPPPAAFQPPPPPPPPSSAVFAASPASPAPPQPAATTTTTGLPPVLRLGLELQIQLPPSPFHTIPELLPPPTPVAPLRDSQTSFESPEEVVTAITTSSSQDSTEASQEQDAIDATDATACHVEKVSTQLPSQTSTSSEEAQQPPSPSKPDALSPPHSPQLTINSSFEESIPVAPSSSASKLELDSSLHLSQETASQETESSIALPVTGSASSSSLPPTPPHPLDLTSSAGDPPTSTSTPGLPSSALSPLPTFKQEKEESKEEEEEEPKVGTLATKSLSGSNLPPPSQLASTSQEQLLATSTGARPPLPNSKPPPLPSGPPPPLPKTLPPPPPATSKAVDAISLAVVQKPRLSGEVSPRSPRARPYSMSVLSTTPDLPPPLTALGITPPRKKTPPPLPFLPSFPVPNTAEATTTTTATATATASPLVDSTSLLLSVGSPSPPTPTEPTPQPLSPVPTPTVDLNTDVSTPTLEVQPSSPAPPVPVPTTVMTRPPRTRRFTLASPLPPPLPFLPPAQAITPIRHAASIDLDAQPASPTPVAIGSTPTPASPTPVAIGSTSTPASPTPVGGIGASQSIDDIHEIERRRGATVSGGKKGNAGKKTQANSEEAVKSVVANEEPKKLEQSKMMAKAKTKLSRFLGQRPDASQLKKAGLLDDGDDKLDKRKPSLSLGKRTTSNAVIARASPSEQHAITEEIMMFFVEQLLVFDAVNTHGIFRVSGVMERSQSILKSLVKIGPLDTDEFSVHDVSSAFKSFLRSAPEPLIPFDSFQPFLDTLVLTEEQERTTAIARLISQLPVAHRRSLFLLLRLCRAIASNSDSNMMTPHNLGIVFGPTIMRERVESPSYLSSANQDFVEDLIERFDALLVVLSDVDPAVPEADSLPFVWLDDLPNLKPSSSTFIKVLPVAPVVSLSSGSEEIRWISSADIHQVSVALLTGESPDNASFVAYLAPCAPNTGSLPLKWPLPTGLALSAKYFIVVEQFFSTVLADAETVFDVSNTFTLAITKVPDAAKPNPLTVLQGLSSGSADERKSSAAQLRSLDNLQLLPLLNSHPEVVLNALRSLAGSVLDINQV